MIKVFVKKWIFYNLLFSSAEIVSDRTDFKMTIASDLQIFVVVLRHIFIPV